MLEDKEKKTDIMNVWIMNVCIYKLWIVTFMQKHLKIDWHLILIYMH